MFGVVSTVQQHPPIVSCSPPTPPISSSEEDSNPTTGKSRNSSTIREIINGVEGSATSSAGNGETGDGGAPAVESGDVVNMKWNSSSTSSSLSSTGGGGQCDRKSTFYTAEPETKVTANGTSSDTTMNDDNYSTTTEVRNPDQTSSDGDDRSSVIVQLKAGSSATLPAGIGGGKKRRTVAAKGNGLDGGGVISTKNHLKLVSKELEWERKFRDDQLSRILKALIYFEARLQSEHKAIRQQLHEKDDVISRQSDTINRMKRKLAEDSGGGDGEDIDLPEVAQYCPRCRKNYYGVEFRCSGTQTTEYREDGREVGP